MKRKKGSVRCPLKRTRRAAYLPRNLRMAASCAAMALTFAARAEGVDMSQMVARLVEPLG